MARSSFALLTVAALGRAALASLRTDILRVDVGECANQNRFEDGATHFPQAKRIGHLPSSVVVQAEADVTSAKLIDIVYGSNFKVLTNKFAMEQYVLTQCGTNRPAVADINLLAPAMNYTRKYFSIPLQTAASDSTIHLAFFEALGVQDRISYVSKYATGSCWQKALGASCGAAFNATLAASSEVIFMDCSWKGCGNVNGQANGVHIAATQDPAPLHSAEHIKFIAAFFNKEMEAIQSFEHTMESYSAAAVVASPKPRVAWISYDPDSWSLSPEPTLVVSKAPYKMRMVTDAGGANWPGEKLNVKLSTFNGSLADASAAFFASLNDIDVVIDETYEAKPASYTFATFLQTMGLTSSSSLSFVQNSLVLRVDGTISADHGLDWYESRVANPDWAVEGLARALHKDSSKRFRYFRNVAAGEDPQVITASACTTNLPVCDTQAYAAAIPMLSPSSHGSGSTTTAVGAVTQADVDPLSSSAWSAPCRFILLLTAMVLGIC